MHFDGTVITNSKHKKNIRITVLNEDVNRIVKGIVTIQDSEFINTDLEVVKDLRKKANKKYPDSFVLELKDRINISKLVVR